MGGERFQTTKYWEELKKMGRELEKEKQLMCQTSFQI